VPIDREQRTDPIILEMKFSSEILESGHEIWNMEGRAHPGVDSGSWFSSGGPLIGSLKEQIDREIESRKRWFAASYPTRQIKLKVTRPDRRQLTLEEAV
jgi:hypothetical protein